jgi:orotate phosphoribosyltransferase
VSDRERLKHILRARSVRTGDFVLASGQRSNLYVDVRLTACKAEAMPLIGRAFLEKMAARGWRPQAVGGLTMGADPIAMAIAHESVAAGNVIDAFVIRKEAKQHGMKRYVEGLPETAGIPVVIVDDVCSTGGSTVKAIERAREAGMNVLGALCLVDRKLGGREAMTALGCPFDSVFEIDDLTGPV